MADNCYDRDLLFSAAPVPSPKILLKFAAAAPAAAGLDDSKSPTPKTTIDAERDFLVTASSATPVSPLSSFSSEMNTPVQSHAENERAGGFLSRQRISRLAVFRDKNLRLVSSPRRLFFKSRKATPSQPPKANSSPNNDRSIFGIKETRRGGMPESPGVSMQRLRPIT